MRFIGGNNTLEVDESVNMKMEQNKKKHSVEKAKVCADKYDKL